MKLIKDKPIKKVEKHRWFAWKPVFAWEGDLLHLVWLEWVWRKSGGCIKWRHEVIASK